jgi:hypothetical protein
VGRLKLLTISHGIHLLLQGRKEMLCVFYVFVILWRKGNLSIFDFEKPRQNGLTTKEMENRQTFPPYFQKFVYFSLPSKKASEKIKDFFLQNF